MDLGPKCNIVAPSLIPKKARDRVKTDGRDVIALTRLYRAGELTPVWVPDKEQEAIRNLTRARENMKSMEGILTLIRSVIILRLENNEQNSNS